MMPSELSSLANHLWQSTLCAAAVWLLTLALKKNRAAVRYWLWLAASVKFLVPFSPLVKIGSNLGRQLAPTTAIVQPEWSYVVEDIGRPFATAFPPGLAHASSASIAVPTVLFAIWLCGFAVSLTLWLGRWRQLRVARRGATSLMLSSPIPVMCSPVQIEPGVFGICRPVLLLPTGIMDRLTPAQLEAIVDHEMCHVHRRDNVTAAIHMLAEALFWFYPLLWWIRARLLEERERACDEEVLRLGNNAEIYVEGILNVCKFYCESTVACVSGISGSDLKKRIVRIMMQRLADRLSLGRKLLLAAAGLAVAAGPLIYGIVNTPHLSAQVSPQSSIESQPSFEVVSIRLNRSGDTHSHIETPPGRFIARNVTTKLLIEYAYNVRKIQLSGGPSWIDSERYDVNAKMGGGSGAKGKLDADDPSEELELELQSLLQDRFKLSIAPQAKELPIYALVVAKNGPKLQEATLPPGHMLTTRNGQITAKGAPVRALAAALSGRLDRMVLDKTGLTGIYDFTLQWAPDEAAVLKSASDTQVSPGATQPDFSGPSIFTAVQEQLGLKLESQKGPVKILVIDHVEKPSEN